MKQMKQYTVLAMVLFIGLTALTPALVKGYIPEPPPGGPTIYYGSSYSYSGIGVQGTISDTYYDGDYLTVYPWGYPVVGLWLWRYFGHLRINFDGQKASILAVEYYNVPYTGVTLKIMHTDGYSKSWSGYHGQYVELAIDSSKPVSYVQLTMDTYGLPIGAFLQFDRCWLEK